MYYLTELLGLPVRDAEGRLLGRLREIVLEPGSDPNLVRTLIYRRDSQLWQVPVCLAELDRRHLRLGPNAGSPMPFQSDGGHLLLRRDVMDQQIIDVNGRKVVRVNDVDFEVLRHNGCLDIRAVQVDVGLSGALRRLFQGVLPRAWMVRLSTMVRPRVIPWHMFNLIETDPARRVKLQISYDALARLHPADVADIVEDLAPAERGAVFGALDADVAADVLGEVEPKVQRSLLAGLAKDRAADIVEEMDPDEAADVLAELPTEVSEGILEGMQPQEREDVSDLLEFPEHTAGGRMTTDFIALPETARVGDAVRAMREKGGPIEGVNTIFLLDEDGRLRSMVPLARVVLASNETPLTALASEAVAVQENEKEDEIAELFDKYNLMTLPVVDGQRHLVGIITFDDVIALLRERR